MEWMRLRSGGGDGVVLQREMKGVGTRGKRRREAGAAGTMVLAIFRVVGHSSRDYVISLRHRLECHALQRLVTCDIKLNRTNCAEADERVCLWVPLFDTSVDLG